MYCRVKIIVKGAVQGVGFRPFIFRLANEFGLKGFVLNSSSGVLIEAENDKPILDNFILRIQKEKPPASIINSLEFSFLDPVNFNLFEIRESSDDETKSTLILPDISVCCDCVNEMLDPKNRRYLYPFINCTNCGPRYSIIEALPYDRPNTSMREFLMCDDCKQEYLDPSNRRFHAQPIACHACGPQVKFYNNLSNYLAEKNDAINLLIQKIIEGKIIALKGIGGYQLIADAGNDTAVKELRKRKHREEKPFALMFPDLQSVKSICEVDELEERLLLSPESPIVILKKKNLENSLINISELVAPANPYLGIMLPYSPLHHLLIKQLNKPIIATSANISEEPIIIDDNEAFEKLNNIADYFLIHNREILRQVDDSIARIVAGREMIIRRARGFAPLPFQYKGLKTNFLSVGAHLKNTISMNVGENIFLSQHIGDLSSAEACSAFEKTIQDFQSLYNVKNHTIVSDLHPDYYSTNYAKTKTESLFQIQHHCAHIAACAAENELDDELLGVCWDGTGYGDDGKIWGGEFFLYSKQEIKRAAHFHYFPLPGGDYAVKEPRRTAIGLMYEIFKDEVFNQHIIVKNFSADEIALIKQALIKKINCPLTSSAGRLFDAVSSLLNISQRMRFEGQAAMNLEFIAGNFTEEIYNYDLIENETIVIDWQKMFLEILDEIKNDVSSEIISAKFHNTMTEIICTIAKRFHKEKVVLSGGVFQNVYLLKRTIEKLTASGFKPYWHQRIPTNDGGISVGQIVAANNILNSNK